MTNASTTKDAHNSRDVIKIKCSPDGQFVATSGFDGFVRVWSFPHLEPICSHHEAFCSKVSRDMQFFVDIKTTEVNTLVATYILQVLRPHSTIVIVKIILYLCHNS